MRLEVFTAPQVTADDHVRGPADAPVTVIEYGDYECPYCRGAARDVHLLLDRYPGTVQFVFRNFPIPQLHPHAEQAAEAAEAAASQGKFWEMYELLLQPSSRLDIDSLRGYAIQVGLDVSRFRRDLASRAYAARIERDVREGIRNGVNATPKFYVNGKPINGAFPLEGLVDAVRATVTASAARAGLAAARVSGLAGGRCARARRVSRCRACGRSGACGRRRCAR
jgi:protein-disulfide isomerase